MPRSIEVPGNIYKRLESHARGFDTPASVIERLLDAYEQAGSTPVAVFSEPRPASVRPSRRPELFFLPNESGFRDQLLTHKIATVKIEYADGSAESKTWRADRFSETSNLRGNLWSGFLRGWSEKGIVKATFSVPPMQGAER